MTWRAWVSVLFISIAQHAGAVECTNIEFEDLPFSICEITPATDDLRLFHHNADGENLGSFRAIERETGRELLFGMNAGMYHDDRSAVGLYIEEYQEQKGIVTRAGPGNFGLRPNGVFCIADGYAAVIESRTFAETRPNCRFATQSGPMLVIDGALHPRFIKGGTSTYIRNGVGVRPDGKVIFAISNWPVNFDTFGRLFRDQLDTPNALFLDGKISRLYSPELQRNDFVFSPMGPMVGVLGAAKPN